MNATKGKPIPKFAEMVRTARESAGISQAQLAKLCGCGNSAISDIERGTRAPSLDLAARIADALKLPTKLAHFAR
jgi:transcriptional regulator with XRE-family HTH domain